ncbi:alpha/beta hydrolase family protein [Halosolutus amylolyticus]|uniref:Alpha/beta hydrolase family protein n=1 Tax=Halosolutus amylolyticus TaxID=2932267 RepID=A0ABD5PPS3_9EURY|nr:alpha/beta fold hydrolase [Halosolutus amylolyticus]
MAERHRIAVTDDESVAAVHHAAPSNRWLVFCHGFLSDKSGSYERRALRAVDQGFNAVRFDFRGCGESDGVFADQPLGAKIADLSAVADYFDPDSLVLFGSSFGGKVAFHATARDRVAPAAIATRAPVTRNDAFAEYEAVVREEGACRFDDDRWIDRRFFDDLASFPFDEVVDAIEDVPIAIFHGRADESVPIEHSFDAASALEIDVVLEAFVGEGHVFTDDADERVLDRLFEWLAALDRV